MITKINVKSYTVLALLIIIGNLVQVKVNLDEESFSYQAIEKLYCNVWIFERFKWKWKKWTGLHKISNVRKKKCPGDMKIRLHHTWSHLRAHRAADHNRSKLAHASPPQSVPAAANHLVYTEWSVLSQYFNNYCSRRIDVILMVTRIRLFWIFFKKCYL